MYRRLVFKIVLLLTVTVLVLTACNPLYLARAGYEEALILLAREPIESVIARQSVDDEKRRKLQLVSMSRNFALEMGLTPGKSFTTFSQVRKNPLVWVLVGSQPDSFSLYTWWYPIVGSVPYKGYFNERSAKRAAASLERKGYETRIRGSSAFSTLGWFNDPILSTTLLGEDVRVINTVLHELVHNTIWIRGHVDFNESLANFVGYRATIDFLQDENQKQTFLNSQAACSLGAEACQKLWTTYLARAQVLKEAELSIADGIRDLYLALQDLYAGDYTREEKIAERSIIFERLTAPMHKQYPDLRILHSINNAEIMQLRLYMTRLDLFKELYEKKEGDWPKFFDAIREVNRQTRVQNTSPFVVLEEYLAQI